MFDLLTEAHLNEIFNADSLGTVYPVENLTPKAKVPQMLHMKVPGTNDLIIRLTHLDTVGTRVKAVMPGDKTVQVFLMSLSDKGNITDFRGGLGSDPVGAINTMFSTVMEISKKFHFESVLFRFTKTKMKGKSTQVTRVLSRLISQRSAGRFTTLEEVTRTESKKFDFVLAIKKNSNLIDSLVTNANGYQKVETKAGDTFIDTETGETVSKAEIAAEVLTSQSAKISDQQIASKSKISRRAAYKAMYSAGESFQQKRSVGQEKVFQKLMDATPVAPSAGEQSLIQMRVIDSVNMKSLANSLRTSDPFAPRYDGISLESADIVDTIKSVFELTTKGQALDKAQQHIEALAKIIEESNPVDGQSTIAKIANYFSSGEFADLSYDDRKMMVKSAVRTFVKINIRLITEAYTGKVLGNMIAKRYTQEEYNALADYTGSGYNDMNKFLIGRSDSISEQRAKNIELIDSVFENKGDTLQKGTVLYRGMELKVEQLKTVIESKIMYFANIVSTSMIPVIYSGSFADVHTSLDAKAVDMTKANKIEDILQTNMFYSDAVDVYKDTGRAAEISIGMAISGAEKINVIVPGTVSSNETECEVILPRGTAMKVTKVIVPGPEAVVDSNALMYLTVIPVDQLNESMDIIDGDKFLNEGVVEKFKFSSMFGNIKTLNESTLPDTELSGDLILDCLEFDNIPAKFME